MNKIIPIGIGIGIAVVIAIISAGNYMAQDKIEFTETSSETVLPVSQHHPKELPLLQ